MHSPHSHGIWAGFCWNIGVTSGLWCGNTLGTNLHNHMQVPTAICPFSPNPFFVTHGNSDTKDVILLHVGTNKPIISQSEAKKVAHIGKVV